MLTRIVVVGTVVAALIMSVVVVFVGCDKQASPVEQVLPVKSEASPVTIQTERNGALLLAKPRLEEGNLKFDVSSVREQKKFVVSMEPVSEGNVQTGVGVRVSDADGTFRWWMSMTMRADRSTVGTWRSSTDKFEVVTRWISNDTFIATYMLNGQKSYSCTIGPTGLSETDANVLRAFIPADNSLVQSEYGILAIEVLDNEIARGWITALVNPDSTTVTQAPEVPGWLCRGGQALGAAVALGGAPALGAGIAASFTLGCFVAETIETLMSLPCYHGTGGVCVGGGGGGSW